MICKEMKNKGYHSKWEAFKNLKQGWIKVALSCNNAKMFKAKIGKKRETLTEKMKRSPEERHK